ncbi:MAG: hypothetical protein EB066_09210 [Betaproteobacteria bacterium]|nr:hypothetical protein [Betaproteobacteria bacterium]NDF06590.1 hypothetical protein [Betaproteobacteria bacterium]
MNKSLVGALAFVYLPLSQAAWVSVANTADAQVYYDDAISKEGDRVTVWRLTNFAKPLTNLEGKEISSEKSRTTVDCASRKMANSQVMRFSGKDASGEVLNQYETPLRFTTVATGSVDAALVQKLCAP